MDNLYYPVNPTPGGDPFGGRFGNNPGLMNYLIANGFGNTGTPATPPSTPGGLPGIPGTQPPPVPAGPSMGDRPNGGWMGGHGNDGHAAGGLGSATPGGMDAGLGNFNGSGMGPAAPGMTIGAALANALSPAGTMIGALLGNNSFTPAGGILASLGNMGRGLLGGGHFGGGFAGAGDPGGMGARAAAAAMGRGSSIGNGMGGPGNGGMGGGAFGGGGDGPSLSGGR